MVASIQNIKFYSHPQTCIDSFERKSWVKKAQSLILSFGTLFNYVLSKMTSRNTADQMASYTQSPSTGFIKQRLIVCIHGLNNNPAQFKTIVDEINKRDLSNTQIYTPFVLQKGNAKLNEMVKPIFEEIEKWAATDGEKELVLIGVSNGGRISRAIEAEINAKTKGNIKKVKFVSIVGACKGSALINYIKDHYLSWLVSKNISEEMPTNSNSNHELNFKSTIALRENFDISRDYTFIASPHDWQVTNYSSTLMETPGFRARYAIVPGHGHNSIVNAVAESIAQIVLT